MGKSESYGVARGVVQNIDQTVQSIRTAVADAENKSGVDIKIVNVGIAGQHIKSNQHRGIKTRSSIEEEISQKGLKSPEGAQSQESTKSPEGGKPLDREKSLARAKPSEEGHPSTRQRRLGREGRPSNHAPHLNPCRGRRACVTGHGTPPGGDGRE